MFATEILLDNKPCLQANATKYPLARRKANSYHCPLGANPGKAWVLMKKSDVDALSKTDSLQLVFRNHDTQGTTTNTFRGLYLIRASRILRGTPADASAAFLVELADKRCLLTMTDTGNAQYNVRSNAAPQQYISGTEGYTWSSMAANLWGKMESILGPFPGLPNSPHGLPENWRFIGTNAWQALHQVLESIGCTTAYNPLTESFSIVQLGSTQTEWAQLAGTITHDVETIYGTAHKLPATIRVHFPTRQPFGQERDTEADANWSIERAAHHIDISTELGTAGTIVHLWDDLTLAFDESDQPSNLAELQARANQRADNYVQRLQTPKQHKLLVGIDTSVLPGGEVRQILWRHWGESLGGTITEISSGTEIPGTETFSGTQQETLPPAPDLQRGFPTFPRLTNAIEIVGPVEEEEPGQSLTPNQDNMWFGNIRRYVGGSVQTLESCLVLCPEYNPFKPKLKLGQVVLGRLSGTRLGMPVYLAEVPQPPASQVHWGIAEESIDAWAEAPDCTTISVQLQDTCAGGGNGDIVSVVLPKLQDKLPHVQTGDLLAISQSIDIAGQPQSYVCISDYTLGTAQPIRWGAVVDDVTQWQTPPDCTLVEVIVQDFCYGGGEGETLFVSLPKIEGAMPNLKSGDVIAFSQAIDIEGELNQYVCLSDYTISGNGLVAIVLTEDVGQSTPGSATASTLEWDFTTTIESTVDVYDHGDIFADGLTGSKGIAVQADGQYHIVQLSCGS